MPTSMTDNPETQLEVWKELAPHQQEAATSYTEAMADLFGVSTDQFSIVHAIGERRPGKGGFYVLLDGEKGIDTGDPAAQMDALRPWDAIRHPARDEEFTIKVDNVHIDTRNAMTIPTYRALASPLREHPLGMPDDFDAFLPLTRTWLTGEDSSLAAHTENNGQPQASYWPAMPGSSSGFLFRPGAQLPQ